MCRGFNPVGSTPVSTSSSDFTGALISVVSPDRESTRTPGFIGDGFIRRQASLYRRYVPSDVPVDMTMNSDAIHARQHERHAVSIEARIEPHPDHSDQYRLAVPDAQSGLAVTDVSGGGLGLRSGIFVPKRMKVIVHVLAGSQETGMANEVIRVRAIARRCEMIDHKPTYFIGLQFADANGVDEKRLIAVANDVVSQRSDEPVAVGEAGDA